VSQAGEGMANALSYRWKLLLLLVLCVSQQVNTAACLMSTTRPCAPFAQTDSLPSDVGVAGSPYSPQDVTDGTANDTGYHKARPTTKQAPTATRSANRLGLALSTAPFVLLLVPPPPKTHCPLGQLYVLPLPLPSPLPLLPLPALLPPLLPPLPAGAVEAGGGGGLDASRATGEVGACALWSA
jgi:hypothetical protein